MTTPAPSFEAVFSTDYWQPIPELTNRVNFREALQLHRGTTDSIVSARENLLLAVSRLIEGEEPQRIEAGELVGGPDDCKYALPGAVILLDEERVRLGSYDVPGDYDGAIKSEAELAQPAISAFLSNRRVTTMKDEPNYAVYNTYEGKLISPKGKYFRTVNLYAYYLTKRGFTAAMSLSQWRNEPGGPQVIAFTGLMRSGPWFSSSRAEETINQSHPNAPSFYRIREAHLCLRGVAEKVRVRSKAKLSPTLLRSHTTT